METQGVTLQDEMGMMAPGWCEAFEAKGVMGTLLQLNGVVEEERKQQEVAPPRGKVLEAFKWFSPADTRVVILGQGPYPGRGDACGLSFSVPAGQRLPGSLRNIFTELGAEFGMLPRKNGDLRDWAAQGVLLLNSALTVRVGSVGSHGALGWERVTDAVLTAVNGQANHCVFMLWGKVAQHALGFIDASRHCVLMAAHPSPLSAYRGFFGCGHFRIANDYLQRCGRGWINWYAGDV